MDIKPEMPAIFLPMKYIVDVVGEYLNDNCDLDLENELIEAKLTPEFCQKFANSLLIDLISNYGESGFEFSKKSPNYDWVFDEDRDLGDYWQIEITSIFVGVKSYEEVRIGDRVYHCDAKEYEGTVTWKGKAVDLPENELSDWEMTAQEIDVDYNILKVDTDQGIICFNYDCDPSGVFALKE